MLQRTDVVLSRGRLALLNERMTPQEAMVADLLFVRAALDTAGVEYLLVRGNDDRPVLVADWRDHKKVRRALVTAAAGEPFYSKAIDGGRKGSVLLSEGKLAKDKDARAVAIFRPRVTASGGLRYGVSTAVILQFWDYGDDVVHLPLENALMRREAPRTELVPATVERYGFSWRTLEGMFEPLAGDIDFEIDIVYSWVDGGAIEWQRARARRMRSYVVGEGDDSHARYRQLDELKYALRSVHLFAPWVRTIYVVTDSPVPEWLAEHPRVRIMRSEQFFADTSVLPTHNSHAVESQIANIEGLSEHFIYSNDDMFFGRAVSPAAFFSPGGITKFIEATTRIGLGGSDITRSGFENAARVNRALLEKRFGRLITRHLEHTPVPMRRSVVRELKAEFPDEFVATAASAFRSATDISVTNSLYHFYALITGRALTDDGLRALYVDTTAQSGLALMRRLPAHRDVDLFCLNDGSFPEVSDDERADAIKELLEHYFPIAAPWERAASVADAPSAKAAE